MFLEQVSSDNLLSSVVYMLGAVSILLVIAGLGLVDMGLVRSRNILQTWVQKLLASVLAGFGMLLFGYGIWQWQFYDAFGIPSPYTQAISDWWVGGPGVRSASVLLDPKLFPEADVQQIFVVFFVTFAMATAALVHSSVVERIRSGPLYVMSFLIGAVLAPLAGWLTWGPLSPLTNRGLHDFEGVLPLYVFAGIWGLVLAWRLGPRRGALSSDPAGLQPAPSNFGLVAVGVFLILFAVPFVCVSSTFITVGKGVWGISSTVTGVGLILVNVFSAMLSGALMGGVVGHLRKEPAWIFFGPLAGVIMSGTLFDIGSPLECLLFGALGPIIALSVSRLVLALGLDEPKLTPLALGPGVAGVILVGFTHWGAPTGGFSGLEGNLAIGHAHITPLMQLAGVAVIVLLAGIPALAFAVIAEMTVGLRISADCELNGQDQDSWGMTNASDDLRTPTLVARTT